MHEDGSPCMKIMIGNEGSDHRGHAERARMIMMPLPYPGTVTYTVKISIINAAASCSALSEQL